jgi:hypothetical protein
MDRTNQHLLKTQSNSREHHRPVVVLFDDSSSFVSSFALHTRPPNSALGFHHAMLSGQEGILSLIQFPLLVQELSPQLYDHRWIDHHL